jgi:hypothetical protein
MDFLPETAYTRDVNYSAKSGINSSQTRQKDPPVKEGGRTHSNARLYPLAWMGGIKKLPRSRGREPIDPRTGLPLRPAGEETTGVLQSNLGLFEP